jgi:hypothetical protein
MQEAAMTNLDENVTVLHSRQPAPRFAPEFEIAGTTGYAASEDGTKVVLRAVTADGDQLMLIVPTLQVELMVGALRAAKMVAAGKMNSEEGQTSVFSPRTWETISVPNYDGVLIRFDRDSGSEMVVGMDHASAHKLGRGLQHVARDVGARPKLLVPNKEIIR